MSSKKLALCFSGQMRNLEKTYTNFIKPNLYDCNPDWAIDVFAHSWFDKNDIGKEYPTATGKSACTPIPLDVLTKLYNCYNPNKVLFEKQITFDEKNYAERKASLIVVKYSLSKMYSIRQSALLQQKASQETTQEYDAVFLARYDIGIEKPIILNELNFDVYNCSQHGATNNGIDVTHAVMSPAIFDTFSSLYYNLERLWNEGCLFVDEQLAGVFLRENNIIINRTSMMNNYHLVRE